MCEFISHATHPLSLQRVTKGLLASLIFPLNILMVCVCVRAIYCSNLCLLHMLFYHLVDSFVISSDAALAGVLVNLLLHSWEEE